MQPIQVQAVAVPADGAVVVEMSPVPPQWACGMCTFLNPASAAVCGACGAARPAARPAGVVVGGPYAPSAPALYGDPAGAGKTAVDGAVPTAVATPIEFDGAPVAAGIAQPAPPTEYDHKNHIFLGSLFLNVVAFLAFVAFFAKLNSYLTMTPTGGVLDRIEPIFFCIFCPILITWYANHSFNSASDMNYLANIMRDVPDNGGGNGGGRPTAYGYFDRLCAEKPTLTMHVECFHHERRTSGSGKNRRTRRVKVVTYRGSRAIQFGSWYDQSDKPTGLEAFSVIKMSIKKVPITFADQQTATSVQQQKERFQNENRHRDVGMSFSEVYELSAYKGHVLFVHGSRSGCLQQRFYVLCTYLCLNWAFRYWMECAAVRTTVNISKVISIGHGFNPTYVDLPAQEKAALKAQGVNKRTKSWACIVVGSLWILTAVLCNALVFEPGAGGGEFDGACRYTGSESGTGTSGRYSTEFTRCCDTFKNVGDDNHCQEECLLAVVGAGYTLDWNEVTVMDNSDQYPPACSYDSNERRVYYNRRAVGQDAGCNDRDIYKICKN